MSDFILIMWKPFLACLFLTGIHAWLGMHVIKREIIFVDLSLAQVASLGALIGILWGGDLHSQSSYLSSLAAALAGAVVFALSRTKKSAISQEVIIGVVYAVSAALSILILQRIPEGDEQIRHMLVGNILLVSREELIHMSLLYTAVGALHFLFRKPMAVISEDPEKAKREGYSIWKWDLLFYASFAVVVTSSVAIAGVLLVFSYLIIPAVMAFLIRESGKGRLIWSWMLGALVSVTGITVSYGLNLPTGATIVCTFGFALLLLTGLKKWLNRIVP